VTTVTSESAILKMIDRS